MTTPNWQPSASLQMLQARARLKRQTHEFFHQRGVLEIDVPLLQNGPNIDHGVTPMAVGEQFLITSPEHPLKRCVAAGYGDAYSLTPCFRSFEVGSKHNPEFHMLEWYRLGWDHRQLAEETIRYISEISNLSPAKEVEWLDFHEAYKNYASVDYDSCSVEELQNTLGELDLSPEILTDRSLLLNLVLTEVIEPQLGNSRFTILIHYPANQAAQARTIDIAGRTVASRFEIYYQGLELANGYHECTEAGTLRQRMREDSADTPLDEQFLEAMEHGLPNCAGVAVGFDRVCMLALGASHISQVRLL